MELYWVLIILVVLFVWGSATALKALDRYAKPTRRSTHKPKDD